MNFFYDAQGRLIKSVPTNVYQGSNKASRIWFAMPTSSTNIVNVAFTLPNGKNLKQRIMTNATDGAGVPEYQDELKQSINLWYYDLKQDVTSYAGQTMVQFFVSAPLNEQDDEESEITAVDSAYISVLKGIPPTNLPAPENEYQAIITYIEGLNTSIANLQSALESLDAVSIEYIDNALKGKLDKYSEPDANFERCYTIDRQGNQTITKATDYEATNTIVRRDANGMAKINCIEHSMQDKTVINKRYADQQYSQKLYRHVVRINDHIVFSIVNTMSTELTKDTLQTEMEAYGASIDNLSGNFPPSALSAIRYDGITPVAIGILYFGYDIVFPNTWTIAYSDYGDQYETVETLTDEVYEI